MRCSDQDGVRTGWWDHPRRAGPAHPLRATALLALLAALLVSTGCVRIDASMSVNANDRVSGELVVATRVGAQPPAPPLEPPDELGNRVQVEPYEQENYTGSRMSFRSLTFAEFNNLAEHVAGQYSEQAQLRLERDGSLVTFSGATDLTSMESNDSTVNVEITFDGEVIATTGTRYGSDQVRWSVPSGRITELNAVSRPETFGLSWVWWFVLVGLGMVGTSVLVAGLAFRSHRRAREAA